MDVSSSTPIQYHQNTQSPYISLRLNVNSDAEVILLKVSNVFLFSSRVCLLDSTPARAYIAKSDQGAGA